MAKSVLSAVNRELKPKKLEEGGGGNANKN